MKMKLFSQCVALTVCATLASAQGSNDCAGAQPIAGLGTFPFDSSGATLDGPVDCAGSPVRRDVWFDWVAPSTGNFKLRTCNLTTLATRLAVYDGLACPPTMQLVCLQSGCDAQTSMQFLAVMGQHYLLRVGGRNFGPGGVGSIRISEEPCPFIADDSFEDNDTCEDAIPMGDGSTPGLHVKKTDADYWSFDVEDGATLDITVFFTHATGDIDMFLSDGCGDVLLIVGSANDNEVLSHTNDTGSCETYTLRVEHWQPDPVSDCQDYSMSVSGTGACPTDCVTFCASNPNGTGMPALITCAGDPNTSLVLTSTPVPNTTGQFFFGPMMLMGNPFGDGLLCSGGSLTRMLPFISAGMMMQLPNTATFTINYTAPYAAGLSGVKHFQHWFRSGTGVGAGYNTSDGLSVTF